MNSVRIELKEAVHGLGCYVHFPGDLHSRLITKRIQQNTPIPIEIPKEAIAVCVTLVVRFSSGWLRHSRCRINLSEEKTSANLHDEQENSESYGTVTLSFKPSPSRVNIPGALYSKWYFVPSNAQDFLDRTACNAKWYEKMDPVETLNGLAHMPYWNNQRSSIPGSFFAFTTHRNVTYDSDTFQEVFIDWAQGLVNPGSFNNPHIMQEWLATGLMIFGKSIDYASDRTVRSASIIERFSSTARLDGIGDCEDIAKEISMAHADLCTISLCRSQNALKNLQLTANNYTCLSVLTTVKKESGPVQVHECNLLVHKSCIDGYERTNNRSFLIDGTYLNHPNSPNDLTHRPWVYKHAISAMVYDVGEFYFKYKDQPGTYGVAFSDIFPVFKQSVETVWICKPDPEEIQLIHNVLKSNIPMSVKTFGFEHQSVAMRFEQVVFSSPKPEEHMQLSFGDTMSDHMRARVHKLALGFRAPCIVLEAATTLWKNTSLAREVSYTIDTNGLFQNLTIGHHGNVAPARGIFVGHTHHRKNGVGGYRNFNVPTPEDVAVFIAQRTMDLLRGVRAQVSAQVITHKNVYEMTGYNESDGAVAILVEKYSTQNHLTCEGQVCHDALQCARYACKDFVLFEDGRSEVRNKQLFSSEIVQKKYIDCFAVEGVRVRISQMSFDLYTNEICKTF